MSDDKPKPFAEAIEDEDYEFRLHLDGEPCGDALLSWNAAHAITAALNSRVEQREARLRGALQGLRPHARAWNGISLELIEAALAGTGPDYVPRAELAKAIAERDAARAKVTDTWGVLFDALQDTGGEIGPVHRQLMAALGLKVKTRPGEVTVTLDTSFVAHGDSITIGGVVFRADRSAR